jgi:outer membrane protein insertion porin family
VRGQSPDGASVRPAQPKVNGGNTDPRFAVGAPANLHHQQVSRPQPAPQRYPQQPAAAHDPLRQATAQPRAVRYQSPDNYGAYGGTAVSPVSPSPQPYVQPASPYGQQQPPAVPNAQPAQYQTTPAPAYQQPPAASYGSPYGQQPVQPAASQSVGYQAYGTPGYTGATVGTPPAGNGVTPVQYGEQLPDPREDFSTPRDFGGPPLVAPPGNFLSPESLPPPQQPALPIDIVASEAQTGRFMLGAGVNSNAGVVGSIVLDEQNFDWRRFPTSWEDIRSGRAWRGAGQKFRIEAAPGTVVQRYLINFSEPFLFDTPVSFGLSGYYFNRYYTDWMEQRLGGRVTLGYQFTPDFSGNIGLRAEDVLIDPSNDNAAAVPSILAATGHTQLYSVRSSVAHDTRDSTFLPTEGHYVVGTFEYFMGSFFYPQFTLNAQKHWLLRERPDGTGRHTFSYYNQLGFSGSNTPVYERFFAGGFSTLRGFYFRGASPTEASTLNPTDYSIVGGNFQWINSLEYMFPITADDALKGVVFVDFGTVEPNVADFTWSDYRVSPGAGLRVTIPAISAAPIAIDIAAPIQRVTGPGGDMIQNISFFVGMGR